MHMGYMKLELKREREYECDERVGRLKDSLMSCQRQKKMMLASLCLSYTLPPSPNTLPQRQNI